MTTVFPLDQVKSMAHNHGWNQSQHNDTSRVIIFAKNSTKINVYYTTGTVGTCLNHPRRGKTQLFRRNVSLDVLEQIFQNPRLHTGQGYQLRKHNMTWQPVNRSSKQHKDDQDGIMCDMAQRWKFVCAATGLGSDTQINMLVAFFNLWNFLEFEPGEDCSKIANRRTGAGCTLRNFLLQFARDYEGFTHYSGEGGSVDTPIKGIHSIDEDCECYCDDGIEYQKCFEKDLEKARSILRSFNKHLRHELLIWLLGRTLVGCQLVTNNQKDVVWMRDDVRRVHIEYSQRFYPKTITVCESHGVA